MYGFIGGPSPKMAYLSHATSRQKDAETGVSKTRNGLITRSPGRIPRITVGILVYLLHRFDLTCLNTGATNSRNRIQVDGGRSPDGSFLEISKG